MQKWKPSSYYSNFVTIYSVYSLLNRPIRVTGLQFKITVVLGGRLSRSAVNTSIIASSKQSSTGSIFNVQMCWGSAWSRRERPGWLVNLLMDDTNEWLRRTWIVPSNLKHDSKEGSEKKQITCISNAIQKIVPFSAVRWGVSIDHKRSEQDTNYFLSVSTIIFHYSMQVPNPWFKQMLKSARKLLWGSNEE